MENVWKICLLVLLAIVPLSRAVAAPDDFDDVLAKLKTGEAVEVPEQEFLNSALAQELRGLNQTEETETTATAIVTNATSTESSVTQRTKRPRWTCNLQNPCGWYAYGNNKNKELLEWIRNVCDCAPEHKCLRSNEDLSAATIVYRCQFLDVFMKELEENEREKDKMKFLSYHVRTSAPPPWTRRPTTVSAE